MSKPKWWGKGLHPTRSPKLRTIKLEKIWMVCQGRRGVGPGVSDHAPPNRGLGPWPAPGTRPLWKRGLQVRPGCQVRGLTVGRPGPEPHLTDVLTVGGERPRADSHSTGLGGQSPGCELCGRKPGARWHREPDSAGHRPHHGGWPGAPELGGIKLLSPQCVCVLGGRGGVAAGGRLGGASSSVRTR